MDGLTFTQPDGNIRTCPTIYLDQMYQKYQNTDDLNITMCEAAQVICNAYHEIPDISILNDKDYVSKNIIFQLINTEQNHDMLQNIPNRQVNDLSVIYRLVVSVENEGLASSLVNNDLMERYGFNEEELYKMATENTRRIMPPTVRNMSELLGGMIPDLQEDFLPPMWIVSNEQNINGAATIIYDDIMSDLAEKLNSDLYILPSSIHECIVLSSSVGESEELLNMVMDVNMTAVDQSERLSNQVYYYNSNTKELSMISEKVRGIDDMAYEDLMPERGISL